MATGIVSRRKLIVAASEHLCPKLAVYYVPSAEVAPSTVCQHYARDITTGYEFTNHAGGDSVAKGSFSAWVVESYQLAPARVIIPWTLC